MAPVGEVDIGQQNTDWVPFWALAMKDFGGQRKGPSNGAGRLAVGGPGGEQRTPRGKRGGEHLIIAVGHASTEDKVIHKDKILYSLKKRSANRWKMGKKVTLALILNQTKGLYRSWQMFVLQD